MTKKMLRPKYMVYRIFDDGSGVSKVGVKSTDPENIDSPFVLMPRKDPAALYALLQYAQMCEDSLAREIRVWVGKIIEAPSVHGTQDERNRVHIGKKMMDSIE